MKYTVEQLERMLASKTVRSSPRLKALYEQRLARMKHVRSERQERGRELAKRNFKKPRPKQMGRKGGRHEPIVQTST